MSSQYFSKFPKITYDMIGDGVSNVLVTDIIHRAEFLAIVRARTIIFYPYTIKEGETPNIIAGKLYGSPQYHWIVLYANNIHNIWTDWPLDYYQFIAFLNKKYGSVDTASTTIDHYEDASGNWIDLTTYTATISSGSVVRFAYDYETQLNDAKRQISLIDAKYVGRIENELDKLLVY